MAENTLVDKILALQDKYESLQKQLADPEVIADMKKYVQLNKDYKELEPIIKAGLEYKKMVDELAEAKDIMINEKDEDLRDMAKAEIAEIEPKIPEMEEKIKILLIPADPDDSKNAIIEIRKRQSKQQPARRRINHRAIRRKTSKIRTRINRNERIILAIDDRRTVRIAIRPRARHRQGT